MAAKELQVSGLEGPSGCQTDGAERSLSSNGCILQAPVFPQKLGWGSTMPSPPQQAAPQEASQQALLFKEQLG